MSGEFDPVQADATYAERFGTGVKFNLRPVTASADRSRVPTAGIMSPEPQPD